MPIRPENRARYPADWKARSRFVRFVRARGRCEGPIDRVEGPLRICLGRHGEPHPETGAIVVLTTAHVFDDRPEASDLLNLAALCQRCHNRHDAKDRRRRRLERLESESGQGRLFGPLSFAIYELPDWLRRPL